MLEKPCPRNKQIKTYIESLFCQEDEILKNVLSHSRKMGLPNIEIPSHVGKMLYFLAKLNESKRILEIGTLGGYSTIWFARALGKNGHLMSLEINQDYSAIARSHLNNANILCSVDIIEGNALNILPEMVKNQTEPFDFIFIDADKENILPYLNWSIQLAYTKTIFAIDNLIPRGEEIGYPSNHEATVIYSFNEYLAKHPQLETILIPTIVGDQGRLDSIAVIKMK